MPPPPPGNKISVSGPDDGNIALSLVRICSLIQEIRVCGFPKEIISAQETKESDVRGLTCNLGSPVYGVAVWPVFAVDYTGILYKNCLNCFMVENNHICFNYVSKKNQPALTSWCHIVTATNFC